MIAAVNFERDVVIGLLKGYESKEAMAKITADCFTAKELNILYIVIKSYYERFNEMPDGDVVINEMAMLPAIAPEGLTKTKMFVEKARESSLDEAKFKYAVGEVERSFASRQLKENIKEALVLIDKGQPIEAQDYMFKNLIELSSYGEEIRIVDFVEEFKERKDNLLKRRDNPETWKELCIPTYIKELDEELDGGLRNGEFGLWLGVPEGGKSISLQNISVNMALKGHRVALFTIEMTPEQTAYRLDSSLTGIKYKSFRRAQMNEDELIFWENAVNQIPINRLKIIGVPEGCTCRLIEAELKKIGGLFRPDIVIVDYANIMSPNEGRFQSSMDWKFVGEVVRNLKGLALKLNLPTWSAGQLLVGSKEKEQLGFGDIGLARQQIAAHTDVCIGIIRTSQMEEMDQARLQFIKAREGVMKRFIDITTDFDRIKLSKEELQ